MSIVVLTMLLAGPQTPAPPGPPGNTTKATTPTAPRKKKKQKKVTTLQPPVLPAKVEPANPVEQKLDGALLSLMRSVKSGGLAQANAEASAQKLADPKSRIKVDITITAADQFKDVEAKIREAQGEIVTNIDNRIFAWLPLSAIEPLASAPNVWSMAVVHETVVQQ